jgi:hypothetical protein
LSQDDREACNLTFQYLIALRAAEKLALKLRLKVLSPSISADIASAIKAKLVPEAEFYDMNKRTTGAYQAAQCTFAKLGCAANKKALAQ